MEQSALTDISFSWRFSSLLRSGYVTAAWRTPELTFSWPTNEPGILTQLKQAAINILIDPQINQKF